MPTVLQWVNLLLKQIEKQTAYAAPYEKRYNNEYVLPFLAKEYREVYGTEVDGVMWPGTLEPPRAGMAGIVVDALTERLILRGWSAVDDDEAQRLLDAAWEDSALDVTHREGHREALLGSRAFVSVHRAEAERQRAVVGVESLTQMAVHRRPGPPYDVDVSLKVAPDEWTGRRRGLLRMPGYDIPLVEQDEARADPEDPTHWSRWTWDPESVSETGVREVPVVELAHRRRLLKEPTSEIEQIATSVDVVDLVDGLMVFAGHFGAVPIRYGTGITVPRDPKDSSKALLGPNGKPLLAFNPKAHHMWIDTNPEAKFGQLTPAGLASFVTWAEHASGRIRAKTSLASTYFSLDLKSHMSAELLKTDEAPMMRRVRSIGMEGSLNADWRKVGRWVLEIEDPGSKARPQGRWADPETRIETQQVDIVSKLVSAGMGVEAVATEVLDWSPEQIKAAVQEYEARQARVAEQGADPIGAALLRDAGVIGSDTSA